VALFTTIGMTMTTDLPTFLLWLIPLGTSALVGYFTALLTTRTEIAGLKAEMEAVKDAMEVGLERLGDEMRRYYQPRHH
jgi:hypothetical protein